MVIVARKWTKLTLDHTIDLSQLDDLVAMRRIADGEINEIDRIITSYGLIIWTLARKFTVTPDEAMAAFADIVKDIISSAEDFDPAKTGLLTFIKQISHRRLMANLEFTDQVRLPR